MSDEHSLRQVYSLFKSYNHTVNDDDQEYVPNHVLDIVEDYEFNWVLLVETLLEDVYENSSPYDCYELSEKRGVILWIVTLLELVTDSKDHAEWYKQALPFTLHFEESEEYESQSDSEWSMDDSASDVSDWDSERPTFHEFLSS